MSANCGRCGAAGSTYASEFRQDWAETVEDLLHVVAAAAYPATAPDPKENER